MKIEMFEKVIVDLFGEEELKKGEGKGKGEYGFTYKSDKQIKRIGYTTNLTPEVVEEGIKNKVDLILTHHDAWDFVHGMRAYCVERLNDNNISHYYIHLPLDAAEFGTTVTLSEKLGLHIKEKFSLEDGYYTGRISEFDEPIEFEELVNRMENVLKEPVKYWKNNENKVKRVGMITGAGFSSDDIKEAVDLNCDTYITGEKIMYTVHYSQFAGINLIVGSHTFTEIFGVESLANKIKERFNEVEIIKLKEKHIE